MSDFSLFSQAVTARYTKMAEQALFVAGDGDDAWAHYLASFPPGTDPIYKTNTEHTCSCCKQFVRNIGNLVTIKQGVVQTVWALEGLEYPYNVVAASMDAYVKAQPVVDLWSSELHMYGAVQTLQQAKDGPVTRWNHFFGRVAGHHHSRTPASVQGTYRTSASVLARGLGELKTEALDTVLGLIADANLYRGEEHLPALTAFRGLQAQHLAADPVTQQLLAWENAESFAARFRNTVIGTLVQDISDGVPLDQAVGSFESKVAPTNYRRPKTLVTPAMVAAAVAQIQEVGLEPALHRRHANITDVTINNVLWADRTAAAHMKSPLETLLLSGAKASAKKGKAAPEGAMGIDEFCRDVLPQATGLEVWLDGAHRNRLMSLTAPVHADAPPLFKWDNGFAWSYAGGVTDSIKERVGKAGGNITNATLRVSLSWSNLDDLDLHVTDPSGNHIFFGNRMGLLDVDMNAGRGTTRSPVENISWAKRPQDGLYKVQVHQFVQRETSNPGFTVQVESAGKVTNLTHGAALGNRDTVDVLTLVVQGGAVVDMYISNDSRVTMQGLPQEHWGLTTETFVKVDTALLSPNHWDDNDVGQKHWLFVLNGCRNPDAVRGVFNEFLAPGMEKHRKVFEMLGDKMKCPPAEQQLSGLGFSAAAGEPAILKVRATTGNGTKIINVSF